jgi:hypothetical protein
LLEEHREWNPPQRADSAGCPGEQSRIESCGEGNRGGPQARDNLGLDFRSC